MTEGGDIIEEEDEAATKPEVRFFFNACSAECKRYFHGCASAKIRFSKIF